MPQVLAVAGFEIDGNAYPKGAVVTFPDAATAAWLKRRKLVEDDAAIVAAAVSGGAAVYLHRTAPLGGSYLIGGARRPVWALFGNSFAAAGEVDPSDGANRNLPWRYTIRSFAHLVSAIGLPCDRLLEYGVGGETSTQILERIKASRPATFDVLVIYGFVTNDINPAKNISIDGTLANAVEVAQWALDRGKIVLWFTEWLGGGNQNNARNRYAQYIKRVEALPRTHPNVVVVPGHLVATPRNEANTLAAKGYALADDLHPVANGILAMTEIAKTALAGMLRPLCGVTYGPNDPYAVTYNPTLGGAYTSGNGPGIFFALGGATGTGPDGFFVRIDTGSGTGATMASSKVAHPTDAGWGGGETGPCWKVSMTGGSAGASFTIAARDQNSVQYTWASGAAQGNQRTYWIRPTVANGCIYRVIGTGNFSSGSDPTGSWPTTLGTEFLDGTVKLLVCKDWRGQYTRALADLYVDTATRSGACSIQLRNRWHLAADLNSPLACSTYAFGSQDSDSAIGATAWGISGGLTWLPSRYPIQTPWSDAITVYDTAQVNRTEMKVALGANAVLDLTIAQLGTGIVIY